MNGYDGQAEAEAILLRARTIAGGRIYEYVPDDQDLERDSSGKIRPYGIAMFGQTIMDDSERTYDTDSAQTFTLPFSVQWVASNPSDLRALASAGQALFMDWRPTEAADYMQTGFGGPQFPTRDEQNRPTRYNRIAHYPVRVNLRSS